MEDLDEFADFAVAVIERRRVTRASLPLLIAVSMLGGCWSGGCTRSSVVPPTASVPTPPPPYVPTVPSYTPRATPSPLPLGANPWKPTAAAREWKYIVIHHTATSTGSVESIHEAHLKKKDKAGKPWLGIGYHFVIGNGSGMTDGVVEPTFRWRQQMHGAHAGSSNADYNQHGIGICLVGNFDEKAPSDAQRQAVKLLVQTLKTDYHIQTPNVIGHRDIRTTECPGKLFPMSEVAEGLPFHGSELSEGQILERTATTSGSSFR